jgi:magnesium transporter
VIGKLRERRRGRGYLGVWDPTGGEAREGSGLPVEEGAEKVRVLARSGRVLREVPEGELGAVLAEPDVAVWVDLVRPRRRSEALLRDVFGLGPLTVEDCLEPLRMPKIDVLEGGGAFISAFAARLDREDRVKLLAVEVDLVVGRSFLVTVRDGPMEEVRGRLESRLRAGVPEGGSPGEALAYEVLDALVDGHLPALVDTATAAEELEEVLDPRNQRSSVEALENLISLKRDLQAFRRLAVAQQEALRRLGRTSTELREYLSDAADNQREVVDMADANRDYVDGAIEAYRMRRDERSELGIRRLTALAGLLGPPTLLSGIYGMNFQVLPGAGEPLGFSIFIGLQLLFITGAAIFLHRRGLL